MHIYTLDAQVCRITGWEREEEKGVDRTWLLPQGGSSAPQGLSHIHSTVFTHVYIAELRSSKQRVEHAPWGTLHSSVAFFVPARNLAVSEKWLDPCVCNSRKRSWKKDIEETFLQSSEFTVTTTIDKRECTTKKWMHSFYYFTVSYSCCIVLYQRKIQTDFLGTVIHQVNDAAEKVFLLISV